jgi:hypothetical protein
MVCSSEREGRYPFDVQHRLIIGYASESQSDFEELRKRICDRLRSIKNKREKLERAVASPLRDTKGLSQHEIVALCAILESRTERTALVIQYQVAEYMRKVGYNILAVNIALEKLLQKDIIEIVKGQDMDDRGTEYCFDGFRVTELGVQWIIDNENSLELMDDARRTD